MKFVACLIFTVALTTAWDPVRPGALIRRIGELIVVNENVRIKLTLSNVSHVKEDVESIKRGLVLVRTRLGETHIQDNKLKRKVETVEHGHADNR